VHHKGGEGQGYVVVLRAERLGLVESRQQSDLLPALKGEGSLRTDHWFVVYRLHPHRLIAGGIRPPRSARPAVDHGPGLRPITPIPHHGEPSIRGSLGLGDMWSPHGVSPRGHTLFQNASEFKNFYPAPRRGEACRSCSCQQGVVVRKTLRLVEIRLGETQMDKTRWRPIARKNQKHLLGVLHRQQKHLCINGLNGSPICGYPYCMASWSYSK